MRLYLLATSCAALLALLVAASAYSTPTACCTYGVATYLPGGQLGGQYDCPQLDKSWIRNGFAKSATRLGKSIFIDTGGGWIATAEDSTTYTLLNRADLETTTKKGSVKNTSSFTYDGGGEEWYESTHACV
jgi:hypothetical protein